MQEMNSSMLGSQSLKQLKQYIRCYNLPSQHALEKDDLVKLIFNTRPLTNQNERHYRKLRDQQYERQVETQSLNQEQQNDSSRGDLFEDNPLSTIFNKLGDLFVPPDPTIPTQQQQQQQSSGSTPPRQRQQQHQQQPQPSFFNYRPPPAQNAQHQQRQSANQRPSPAPQQQQQYYRPPPPQQQQQQQHTSASSYPSYIYPEHRQRQQPPPRSTGRPSTTPVASSSPTPPTPPTAAATSSIPSPSPPPGNNSTVALKEILALSIDPATLSVRTLKQILRTNHVEQNFALEKKDLVARVQQLIEDEKKLQKADHNGSKDDDDEGDIPEDMVCRICYDSVQNCVFLNCGHMATCIDCGLKLVETKNECPICRDSIVRVVRVFRS